MVLGGGCRLSCRGRGGCATMGVCDCVCWFGCVVAMRSGGQCADLKGQVLVLKIATVYPIEARLKAVLVLSKAVVKPW